MELLNDNVIHMKVDNIEFLKFKKLEELGVENAFSLKPLNFRNRDEILVDYKRLFDAINLDCNTLVKPHQMHTDNIIILEKKKNLNGADINLDYLENVDAIITNASGITLATTSADCLCVVLYDCEKKVIANIHSGWRGTFKKIVQKTLLKMQEIYGCDIANIYAFFAPAIRQCHFEVDVDVMNECKKILGYMEKIDDIIHVGRIVEGVQKYNIDNILINKLLLEEVGMCEENIIDSGICSFCNNDKIHSRRADGMEFGLGTMVVMMK